MRFVAIAAIVAVLLLLTGAAPAAITPLPNGTYSYVIIDDGKQTGTSVVRVSRLRGDVVIEEHASPMEDSETSRRTLDPATFAMRSYADESDGKPNFTLTSSGSAAILTQGKATKAFTALPGAPFVVFDYYVALFFHLAATLRDGKTTTLSMLALGADQPEPLVASTGVTSRPATVPAADSGITITLEGSTGTLWYDPQTLVLDEFDLPKQRIAFRRFRTDL